MRLATAAVYSRYPSHSFAINFEELESLHLNVQLIEIDELEMLISILSKMTDIDLVGGFSDGDAYNTSEECIICGEELDQAEVEAAATHEQGDILKDISKEGLGNGINL